VSEQPDARALANVVRAHFGTLNEFVLSAGEKALAVLEARAAEAETLREEAKRWRPSAAPFWVKRAETAEADRDRLAAAAEMVCRRWREGKATPDEIALLEVALRAGEDE
jgi:hypothetical protein